MAWARGVVSATGSMTEHAGCRVTGRVEGPRAACDAVSAAGLDTCRCVSSGERTAPAREHCGRRERRSERVERARVAGGTGPDGCPGDRRGGRRRQPPRRGVASGQAWVLARRRARSKNSCRRARDSPERRSQGRSLPTRSHRSSAWPASDQPALSLPRSRNTRRLQRGPTQATARGRVRPHE